MIQSIPSLSFLQLHAIVLTLAFELKWRSLISQMRFLASIQTFSFTCSSKICTNVSVSKIARMIASYWCSVFPTTLGCKCIPGPISAIYLLSPVYNFRGQEFSRLGFINIGLKGWRSQLGLFAFFDASSANWTGTPKALADMVWSFPPMLDGRLTVVLMRHRLPWRLWLPICSCNQGKTATLCLI